MNNQFLVSVECMTYNQASYIEDAMNGFCVQETNFPYVCTIIDDASTDDEPEVIKKYLQEHFDLEDKFVIQNEETDDYTMTFARHKTNHNCYFAVYYLKYNHYSLLNGDDQKLQYISRWENSAKYIAICEGDDYWTASSKLQKQFDLMEKHPEYSICFHAKNELLPNGQLKEGHPDMIKEFYTTEDVIPKGGSFAATNSLFYRNEILLNEGGLPDFWKKCPIGDGPLILFFSTKGLMGYINETMSVHRFQALNSWTCRHNLSVKKKWNHHLNMNKMYKRFDNYTNGRYRLLLIKKVICNSIHVIKSIVGILFRRLC